MNVKKISFFLLLSFILIFTGFSEVPDWMKNARIVGGVISYDMGENEVKAKIDEYAKQGVSVLLIWTESSDTHNFTQNDKRFLKEVSTYIHDKYDDMKVLVYIAPLEEQSFDVDMDEDGKVDPGKKSIYTEHPEWLQIGIDGRPAVFYGDIAFWIEPTSEDAWLCPDDPEIRKIWYDKIVKLAKTGIDGVWWDVPFFIHYFGDNWNGNWTCHCNDCQNSFKKYTGSSIPDKEDWENPLWRKFIDWRFASMANFIKECKKRAKRINPNFVIINETWDPNNVFSPQAGFSPYYMRITKSNDGIAHEFGAQGPKYYHYYSWLLDTVEGIIYRGVDLDRASWILSYSHTKEHTLTRCASVLFSGSNFYEVGYPEMAGTVDPRLRSRIFSWIKDNEKFYYEKNIHPYTNVAVFYSFPSLKYYGLVSDSNPYELLGIGMLLLTNHIPYQIITDEMLTKLKNYKLLFLPSVFSIADSEIKSIKNFVKEGGTLVVSGEPPFFDEKGIKRKNFPFKEICGSLPDSPSEIKENIYGNGKCIITSYEYGIVFFDASAPTSPEDEINLNEKKNTELFFRKIMNKTGFDNFVKIIKGDGIILNTLKSENNFIIRVNNLKGLQEGTFTPIPQDEVSLNIELPKGTNPVSAEQTELLEKTKPLSFELNGRTVNIKFSIKRHKLIIIKTSNEKKVNPVR